MLWVRYLRETVHVHYFSNSRMCMFETISQFPTQCLAYIRCSIKIYYINNWTVLCSKYYWPHFITKKLSSRRLSCLRLLNSQLAELKALPPLSVPATGVGECQLKIMEHSKSSEIRLLLLLKMLENLILFHFVFLHPPESALLPKLWPYYVWGTTYK